MSSLQLVIKSRFIPSHRLTSYHFYVVEHGLEEDGEEVEPVEVADLFTIPALIHWNDQLKRDIVASIGDALRDVYGWEDITSLQAQAWREMHTIHPDYSASDWGEPSYNALDWLEA